MKKLLLCALLCAPAISSHAADVAAAPIVRNQTDETQLVWKVALALNDVEAARKLVAAPGFSPTLRLESWDDTLIHGALEQRRGEIAALIIESAPAEFFLDGESELTRLGETENVPALRALLARGGFDPNTRGDGTLPPLLEAANDRNVEGVRSLLADTRTDLNARDKRGETALMNANSFAGATQIVQMLLADKRTDVNALDNGGNSALHLHASDVIGTPTLELLLLDPRVKDERKNQAGQTPLDIAVTANNLRGVELMLALRNLRVSPALDARIKALRARNGEAAPTDDQRQWLRIVAKNDVRAASKRIKRADFDPLLSLPGGDPLLNEALLREHAELALMMVEAIDLRLKNPDPFLARTANLPVLLRLLRRADFDPNGGKNGDPLLFTAINNGNIEGVRALLAHPNIRPGARDRLGRGPLAELVTSNPNAAKIAQLLLSDARIDPNLRREDGSTDLHDLAWFAQPAVLRVVAANPRVQLDVPNTDGETPLWLAASKALENAKILLDSGRVKIGPRERAKINEKKAEWGLTQSPLFDETK